MPRHFNLDSFAKAKDAMIATNDRTYGNLRSSYWRERTFQRDYTVQEVNDIIESGSFAD
jgi:hypothetical protein